MHHLAGIEHFALVDRAERAGIVDERIARRIAWQLIADAGGQLFCDVGF
jgi:hypothetical protein